jgi:hypothetical protein
MKRPTFCPLLGLTCFPLVCSPLHAQILETQYPRLLQKCVVVNAPAAAQVLWRMVSPLLSETTRYRVEICSGDFYRCASRLHELVPAEDLPPEIGGSDEAWCPRQVDQWRRAELANTWVPSPCGVGFVRASCAAALSALSHTPAPGEREQRDDTGHGPWADPPRDEIGPWSTSFGFAGWEWDHAGWR